MPRYVVSPPLPAAELLRRRPPRPPACFPGSTPRADRHPSATRCTASRTMATGGRAALLGRLLGRSAAGKRRRIGPLLAEAYGLTERKACHLCARDGRAFTVSQRPTYGRAGPAGQPPHVIPAPSPSPDHAPPSSPSVVLARPAPLVPLPPR